jgi:hypothetical protein
MDAKVLPPHPSLEQYRKQAKDLLRASRDADPDALERISRCLRSHGRPKEAPATYVLADAQLVVAREHGFASWTRFAAHVDALAHRDAPVARFEAAADAIVAGDEAALRRLLREDPALIHARSTRTHHATLLHYLSANGVEDFRQWTPSNAVTIARMLLASRADVDATADTYGGGPRQTTINLLVSSVHPARAGLQLALLDTLLEFGARIDGRENDGSPLLTALAFQYSDAATALAARGARVREILAAAGLGRDDLVADLVEERGSSRPGVPLAPASWLHLPNDPRRHVERGLIWAAALGHVSVVDILARRGVDVGARDEQGFTALHWAAARGRLNVVEFLLSRGAPLEARNAYGGTVLGATVWFAAHGGGTFHAGGFAPLNYLPVLERLLAAGARADAVALPSGRREIDELLIRRGAR